MASGMNQSTTSGVEVQQCADDDLLSSATSDSRSATPEDLIIESISRPLAISLATVFEDLGDKLALVGISFATPFADVRTRHSIEISSLQQAVLKEDNAVEDDEENIWILKQLHGTRIPYKLEFLVNPDTERRQSVTDIMKSTGIKAVKQTECNQKLRIQLHLMANAMVTELVLHSTFNSLIKRIEAENAEQEAILEQYKKVKYYNDYIREIQTTIKQIKMRKVADNKSQQVDMKSLIDLHLEQDFRSNLEDKYVRKFGAAKVNISRNSNFSKERRIADEKHLDEIVDKYDKDFSSLNLRLETLYKDRKRDLERITWLQKKIVDYERIVTDDRRIKQTEAEKRRKKLLERRKAIKIQSWWRGTMVRKWLGTFKRVFLQLYELKAIKAATKAKKGRVKPKQK